MHSEKGSVLFLVDCDFYKIENVFPQFASIYGIIEKNRLEREYEEKSNRDNISYCCFGTCN